MRVILVSLISVGAVIDMVAEVGVVAITAAPDISGLAVWI
jgi:hypothetical protein